MNRVDLPVPFPYREVLPLGEKPGSILPPYEYPDPEPPANPAEKTPVNPKQPPQVNPVVRPPRR